MSAIVGAMWRALAAAGFDASGPRLGYGAHLTLAMFEDAAAVPLDLAAARLGAEPLTLHFAGFGLFPGERPVLWLAPVVTPALLARHAAVLAGLVPHPHYRPGAWVPHVTLSEGDAGALAAVAPLWPGAFAASPDRLELVRFPPVEVLASIPLVKGPRGPASGGGRPAPPPHGPA